MVVVWLVVVFVTCFVLMIVFHVVVSSRAVVVVVEVVGDVGDMGVAHLWFLFWLWASWRFVGRLALAELIGEIGGFRSARINVTLMIYHNCSPMSRNA